MFCLPKGSLVFSECFYFMKTHFLQISDGALSQNLTLKYGTLYFHHCGSRAAVMMYDLTYIFKHDLLHHLF